MKYYVESGCVSSIQFSKNHKQAAIDFLEKNKHKSVGKFVIVDIQETTPDSEHDSKIFFSTKALLELECYYMKLCK